MKRITLLTGMVLLSVTGSFAQEMKAYKGVPMTVKLSIDSYLNTSLTNIKYENCQ